MGHKKLTCSLAHDAASALIASYASGLRKHAKAAATHDVEGIHGMRVASRRLRAALAAHAHLFKKKHRKAFQTAVREITRNLGKARELDVTIAALAKRRDHLQGAPRAAATELLRHLRELRKAESPQVGQAVSIVTSPAFAECCESMLSRAKSAHSCYLADAAVTLRDEYGELLRRFSAWQLEPTEESLHQVRIAFKKLRYHCENLGKLYGARMARFIEELKASQEVLGDWNDIRVLRNYVAEAPLPESEELRLGIEELLNRLNAEVNSLFQSFAATALDFFSDAGYEHAHDLFASARVPCCTPSLSEGTRD